MTHTLNYNRFPMGGMRTALGAGTLLSLFLALGAVQTAHAGLILSGADVITGTGFGADPRILTIQATGNASTESGCDAWSGTALVVGPTACTNAANVGGDEPNPHGFPKDSTPTLASLDFNNASQIGIVFDATQPQNNQGFLIMDSLILKFYSPTGTLLLSEALDNPPLTFNQTGPGNGQTDFLFVLDAAGIAQVNSAIYCSGCDGGDDHISLESTMSAVHGGPESFLAEGSVGVTTVTPEPATLLLIGTGLIGLAALRHGR